MPSFTPPTGSAPAAIPLSAHGSHSKTVIPTLPFFSSAHGSFRKPRPTRLGTDAQYTARRHRELDARYRIQRHVTATAKAKARGRAIGNLAMVAFTVLSIVMAAYALRVDQEQQQMLQERIH